MKIKAILKKIRRLGPSRLIFLIVLVMSNTFAWFIYATRIDSNVSVHVKSWNIVFEADDNEVTDTINLSVDSIYPGMQDYTYDITAYNMSEVAASLSYKILEANILGTQYITVEGRGERSEQVQVTDLTSSQLENKLANDYPFSITVSVSNNFIDEEDGYEQYTFSVVWPYESDNDAADTSWGVAAYSYKEDYPTASSITLKIKVIITQSADSSGSSSSGSGLPSSSEPSSSSSSS